MSHEENDTPMPEGTEESNESTESAPGPELVESEEDILRRKLEEAQARLRAVSKAYKDREAEMASFRERLQAQAKIKQEQQGFQAIKAFFEPVQNLSRSVNTGFGDDPKAFLEGLQLVMKQFTTAMEKLGLTPIPGVGARFDPNYHDALTMVPVGEKAKDGMVMQVFEPGFMVGTKVLQPARVIVGKYSGEAEAEA